MGAADDTAADDRAARRVASFGGPATGYLARRGRRHYLVPETPAAKAPVNEEAKKTVLRHFPYGLYAVTVMSEGEDHGMTANWVMQAAFTPPMLVVALQNESKSLPMIRDARGFAVNVLAEGQRELAEQLGRSSRRQPAKLQGVPSRPAPVTGAPILSEGLGWLECRLVATMPAGDHTLVLGEVVEAGLEAGRRVLALDDAGMKYAG